MGIDIRNGQQLECITCGLCIDACDDMMAKIGKPRGLVDYFALTDEARERTGGTAKPIWRHVLRPRTVLYTSLWSLIGVGLLVALFVRADLDVTVEAVRNPTFVRLSDGSIRNAYDLRLRNKHGEARPFRIGLTGDPALGVTLEGTPYATVEVPADETLRQRVYVTTPPGATAADAARTDFRFWIEDTSNGDRAHADTHFTGDAT